MPSGRYGVYGSYFIDKLNNLESGGILYDSVFTENTLSKRLEVPVHLNYAVNRTHNSGIVIQHYFNLQKKLKKITDSTTVVNNTRRFDAGRFIHTFRYRKETSGYEDDSPADGVTAGIYPVTYGDTLITLDTTYQIHLENNLVYSNLEPDTASNVFPLQYSFGISQHFDKLGNYKLTSLAGSLSPISAFNSSEVVATHAVTSQYSQLIPFGTLRGIIAGKTFFTANGRISLGGYNNGDYELSGSFYQYFGPKGKTGRLFLIATKGLSHPDYFFSTYYSNHFRWDNSLKAQDYITGTGGIELLGYHLSMTFTRISNFTYLNSRMKPEQANGGLAITRADASKIFRPGKWIIDTRFIFQKVSRDSILQLPMLAAKASLSYNLLLFNKVLHTQIGMSVQYNSAYYADAYNPELRMFYRQDAYKTGNYPFADIFINMRVKRARIFIKYQHLNAGLLGYRYEMVPFYPESDAALKVGVSWVFYD